MRKFSGYSLVELMTVIAIIMIISVIGLTNALKPSSKNSISYQARQIAALIEEARARSLAATRDDPSGERIYQVIFSAFPANSTGSSGQLQSTATGDDKTNTIVLAQGVSSCDSNAPQGGLTEIRRLTLPRDVKISSFFPTNQDEDDSAASIQFKVGQLSFSCGNSAEPTISATDLSDLVWTGSQATASQLVVAVSNRQGDKQAYVSVDRFTSGVSVTEDNPLANFAYDVDTFSPRWTGTLSSTLSVSCQVDRSNLAVKFSLAEDRTAAATTDATRPVYYDIYWDEDGGTSDKFRLLQANWQPTSSANPVYSLTSSNINVYAQPATLVFRIWAHDLRGNYQGSPASNPTTDDYRDLSFIRGRDWSCNNQTSPSCEGIESVTSLNQACFLPTLDRWRAGSLSNSTSGSTPADSFGLEKMY